jgi:hypothetical protein
MGVLFFLQNWLLPPLFLLGRNVIIKLLSGQLNCARFWLGYNILLITKLKAAIGERELLRARIIKTLRI